MTIRMLDPTGTDERRDTRLATRAGTLRGKRLGLLSNGKTNATALLEAVGVLLVERYGLQPPVVLAKPEGATRPAAGGTLDRLLPSCDVVVTAIGD
jgi:hypothetical protein